MPTIDVELVDRDTSRLGIAAIAAYLQEHLGQKLTAYIAGIKDPKMVGKWIREDVEPHDTVKARLREGYKAVRMIVEAYGGETAKAWMIGSNTRLDDQAPAMLLRNASSWEQCLFIAPAARAFAGAVD